MRNPRFSLLWGLFCLTIACENEPPQSTDAGNYDASIRLDMGESTDLGALDAQALDIGAPDAGAPPPNTLTWTDCPWLSNAPSNQPNVTGACGTFSVPLDPADPHGRRISLDVRKLEPTATAAADLWLLNGGPGGSAATFEQWAIGLSQLWGDVRIYLLDARGAGRSTPLSCSAEDPGSPGGAAVLLEEWPDCLTEAKSTWGEGLDLFGSTQAAQDLIDVVAHTRQEDVPVFVYGVSYGTYWVQRALRLHPQAFDAVILDSIVDPQNPALARIDEWHDQVGRAYLALCAQDPFCMSKLGADPVGEAERLFEMMDAGHCPELSAPGYTGRDLLRLTFGALISNTTIRAMIPAIVYRALRCEADDINAIASVINRVLGGGGGSGLGQSSPLLFSQLLSRHVVLSELWGPPPPTEELVNFPRTALVSKDIGPAFAPLYDTWPRYTPDEHQGTFPDTSIPMLMINGSLDPQTPIETAQAVESLYTRPGQIFIEMPFVSHGALLSSQITGRQTTCGIILLTQFLQDPQGPLDTSCLDDMVALDFQLNPNFARALMGTQDLYD